MNFQVITAPTAEPVTAAAAFFHLKLTTDPAAIVTGEPQYGEIVRNIAIARQQCEQITRRAFVTQTIRLTMGPPRSGERRGLEWYMSGGNASWGTIELRRPPLISVSSVKYRDDDNVLQTVDPALYFTTTALVPKLCFTDVFTHPGVYLREDAIQIEYVAGYPPTGPDLAANVPESIKGAILLGVQMLVDRLAPNERENIERAQAALLSSYRVVSF